MAMPKRSHTELSCTKAWSLFQPRRPRRIGRPGHPPRGVLPMGGIPMPARQMSLSDGRNSSRFRAVTELFPKYDCARRDGSISPSGPSIRRSIQVVPWAVVASRADCWNVLSTSGRTFLCATPILQERVKPCCQGAAREFGPRGETTHIKVA